MKTTMTITRALKGRIGELVKEIEEVTYGKVISYTVNGDTATLTIEREYEANPEPNLCDDCGMRWVECDACERCGACCDCGYGRDW